MRVGWLAAVLGMVGGVGDGAAREFGAYDVKVEPAEVYPGADRFDPFAGQPPAATAYQGGKPVGTVFRTSDIGYSGKPIEILVGMTRAGEIVGAKTLKHAEPILLVGIPEQKLFDFVTRYVGRNPVEAHRSGIKQGVDAISGATVTAIVINDGIRKAALKVARQAAAGGSAVAAVAEESVKVRQAPHQPADWTTLLGEGAVRRLNLSHGDVDAAFQKMGVGSGEPYVKVSPPDELFIDLYAAMVSLETVGRNLLGEAEYHNLRQWLAPDQHALLIMANGSYSFRGSGFVRGAIFDRFKLNQEGGSLLFRDQHYRRLGLLATGMPEFTEVGLFKIPPNASFDPARPWALELLASRPLGPIEKAYTSFMLDFTLPERFLVRTPPPVPAAAPAAAGASLSTLEPESDQPPLWERIWQDRMGDVLVLSVSLAMLTMIFFFQEWLVTRPVLVNRLRRGFLLFSVVWIGGYAQAQLSVVNVFTFFHALMGGFRWEFFLIEPLIFILWSATALSLLFWGRGAFCGWLCPFGALHELLNWVARRFGVPQYRLPFAWHERLWAFKYIIFLGLLAVSLSSMAAAERLAEVEPFKTVVLLRFDREWPYVLWAAGLLFAGLFVERFFCRYLCPLGAALAIPGRMRIFAWLKRRRQCGELCHQCSDDCLVQAIQPNGEIHPNECLYCLRCQLNYSNEAVCPTLIMRRNRRERRGGAEPKGESES
ncbi:MAG: regulatory protein NosR [Magnetococcales bacterium]|nr:regulatory protein NosR [Magnetococcales bacterium]